MLRSVGSLESPSGTVQVGAERDLTGFLVEAAKLENDGGTVYRKETFSQPDQPQRSLHLSLSSDDSGLGSLFQVDDGPVHLSNRGS